LSALPEKLSALHSIDSSLKYLPEIILEGDNLKKAQNGNPIIPPYPPLVKGGKGGFIRLKDPEEKLFGIGKVSKDSIKIKRLLKL
jgi:hypothetical protein